MPTIDRIKESIFNIIANKIPNSRCLDLFGGTGNLGIECISRGAKKVIISDHNPVCIKNIKQNLREDPGVQIICADFLDTLTQLKSEQFDIVFLDPPYRSDFALKAIQKIREYNLLSKDGIIIWEHPKGTPVQNNYFCVYDTRNYGSVSVSFLSVSEVSE